MSVIVRKTGPTVIVAAMAAWCCWPYVTGSGSHTGIKQQGDQPRITRAELSPTIGPGSDRNPFQVAAAARIDESPTHDPPQNEQPEVPAAEVPVAKVPAAEVPAAEVPITEVTASEKGITDAAGPTEEEDRVKFLGGLMLSATYIQGNRRVAIVNGRIYKQGDPLSVSGTTRGPGTITTISADKVVILYCGRTVELEYANLAATATPNTDIEQRHE